MRVVWLSALLLVQALRQESQEGLLSEDLDTGGAAKEGQEGLLSEYLDTGGAAKDQCQIWNYKKMDSRTRERWASHLINFYVIRQVCKAAIPEDYAQEAFEKMVNGSSSLGLVAEDKSTGEICGFTYGYLTSMNAYHTTLICSHIGYGKKLLQASLQWAQKSGIELAELEAVPRAAGFYEKQNYKYCPHACKYRCGNTARLQNDLYFMSRCLKGTTTSADSWGPGKVDLTTRLSALTAGGSRLWRVNDRSYRCCCKTRKWCKIVDTSAKWHLPVSASTSTCGRYLEGYRSWNSSADPLEDSCVVLQSEIPEELLPEIQDLLPKS